MKKFTLLFLLFVGMSTFASAQATKQLNFGIIGVSYEIPVSSAITIAPFAGSDLNLNYLSLGVKANYYFDELFGLNDEWDVYAGANAGFAMWIGSVVTGTSGVDIGLHIGGRWFWNEKWGVYLELGGGYYVGGTTGVGFTMKL